MEKSWLLPPHSQHQHIVYDCIPAQVSLHLDCSNVSLWVYWMVRHSSDWNSLSAMVSTSWLLSHGWRKAGYSPPLFNKYILSVTASLYMFHWTMTVPMSCIMSILNGEAGFILEIIVCNGLHKLTFESWMDRKVGDSPPHSQHQYSVCDFIPAQVLSLQLHCSNVSLWVYWKVRYSSDWNSLFTMVSTSRLMSHGWREAGYSPQLSTPTYCLWLHPCTSFTAPWLFQCLIMGILKG